MNGWSTIEAIYILDGFLIPVLMGLYLFGWLSIKEYYRIFAGYWLIDGLLAAMLEKYKMALLCYIFAIVFWWLAKWFNDNDGPRKRRKRLKDALGKKIPKPTLVQIRPVGAT